MRECQPDYETCKKYGHTSFGSKCAIASRGTPLCPRSPASFDHPVFFFQSGHAPAHARLVKGMYHKTCVFIQVPRDLPLSGAKRRLITVSTDVLEQCHVTGIHLTIQHLNTHREFQSGHTTAPHRVFRGPCDACSWSRLLVPGAILLAFLAKSQKMFNILTFG